MRYYCTLFDVNYLPNFLALYNSLLLNSAGGFKIYAFCMDEESLMYLSDYKGSIDRHIMPVPLSGLKDHFPQLSQIRKERSLVEFYFTCSPFICTYVFDKEESCAEVTYLDADLLFFNSPEVIFEEIGDSSVAIIAHKFYGWGKRYLKYGKYNVGWVTFKNDNNGRSCLKLWLGDCSDWCHDYYDEEGQRFGDQKYLDKWENSFSGVKVIRQKGANLAPWNAGQYKISADEAGKIFVDQDPLIFYHYASFKKVGPAAYSSSMSRYMARPGHIIKNNIYKRYLDSIAEYSNMISRTSEISNAGILKKNRSLVNQTTFKRRVTNIFNSLIRWYFNDYIYK